MSILAEIIAYKKIQVAENKKRKPVEVLEKSGFFSRGCYSLRASLQDIQNTGIIAEFKRRSPSRGIINAGADVQTITKCYADNGAAALSVLTDENFFGGSAADLEAARFNKIPVLRKDFIVDPYQLVEAKAMGADVILLIAACLSPSEVKSLANTSYNLGMEVLLELHDESELEHICEETTIVGVNNRNLKDFKVDIDRSLRMAEKIPAGKIKVAESGINDPENIILFQQNGFNGFLIGEHFMKQPDPTVAFVHFVKQLKQKQNEN